MVYGKLPPPWAKQTFNSGRRSSTPPKIRQQAARDCSAGMPTSHGNQYLGIDAAPIMSQGCTRMAAPSSLAAWKNSNSSGASRFQSLTWLPICTPCRPSWSMQRSSSCTARRGDCSGTVPMPA